MPLYFRQSKITSFQRQLNLYGFNRITQGPDRGGYYHELFLKHKAFLCGMMPRFRVKGTGVKAKSNPATEPDFYSMPSIKAIDHAPKKSHRDLSGEKLLCVHPSLQAKKQPEKSISQIKDHVADYNVIIYPRMASSAVNASSNVTQVIGSAKPCTVAPSQSLDLTSSTIRHQSQSTNFCLSSYSRVSSDELTSWADPSCEYDGSLTEISVMQFLREPILTPSVSSSSLNAMSTLQGSLEVNTEPNFLDDDWESFAW